jgi:hypothetical protein
MRHASYDDTGRTVAASAYPIILLDCLRCLRRIVFDPRKLPDLDRPVYQWRFRCECGSRDVRKFLAESQSDEATFLAGHDPQQSGSRNSAHVP